MEAITVRHRSIKPTIQDPLRDVHFFEAARRRIAASHFGRRRGRDSALSLRKRSSS
jgi:hypothetical protein